MNIIQLTIKNSEEIIAETIKVLKSGGLVIFPSDTVYGALVDATSRAAVEKLIAFKNRPPGKPISIFIPGFKSIFLQAKVDKKQESILKTILPGPFTVILDSRHKINLLLESEKGSLGIRIPNYQPITKLMEKFGRPVTATSANQSGRSPHYSVETLLNDLSIKRKNLIDLVVDAGKLPRNKPSTVVDLTESKIKVLRRGDVGLVETKKLVSKSPEETKAIAKKTLKNYFSSNVEKKPLVFIIEGELGVGKTIFVKGLGETLGITKIISPTFVIYYEYGNFYHFDLYQIEDKEEFKYLEIEKLLKPGKILCFEWGEKAGEIYDLVKNKAKIIYVKIDYITEKERRIFIKD
ncbi:hypothetical protein A2970_00710 [Candidatus Roizmanbacteria bacterium RIFCSPLOWO2_01_FULL_44_13]|uniref:L-threonylcarbamoyladenylate synthase n=1 Tax=Candidatus Roizmanbacteria bacterium RIFCSPLOWO2_01_FULL_44_13 TaxID=1802069 RepID=A0A1F7JAG1_9BACT|nr:MAG: hypothetical protein A2970_00710 [Candidatus Roizmanbacteria bacterium RIFCSPLOWO2_01_FULL_44_13]